MTGRLLRSEWKVVRLCYFHFVSVAEHTYQNGGCNQALFYVEECVIGRPRQDFRSKFSYSVGPQRCSNPDPPSFWPHCH